MKKQYKYRKILLLFILIILSLNYVCSQNSSKIYYQNDNSNYYINNSKDSTIVKYNRENSGIYTNYTLKYYKDSTIINKKTSGKDLFGSKELIEEKNIKEYNNHKIYDSKLYLGIDHSLSKHITLNEYPDSSIKKVKIYKPRKIIIYSEKIYPDSSFYNIERIFK